MLRDGRWDYVVFGPLALCQNGGVLRFGEVFLSRFDWKKSAEITERESEGFSDGRGEGEGKSELDEGLRAVEF